MQNTEDSSSEATAITDHDGDYKTLLNTLSYDPATTDELAEQSGLTIDQVSSMLLILELEGMIEAQSNGRYSRLKESDQ